MVVFRNLDSETAVVFRIIATSCVSLTVLAMPAIAQCPDGTPPPCTSPSRPEARAPRMGVATLRVLASTPVSGTTLKRQDLEKGVPLHVVVEHAVQRVPRGQTPVLVAFVNLTPDATHAAYQRVLEARLITARPTQRGLNLVLTTEHVRQQRITVAIHIAFSPAGDTTLTSSQGLKLSFDWGASITLEFPVADSSSAPFAPPQSTTSVADGGTSTPLSKGGVSLPRSSIHELTAAHETTLARHRGSSGLGGQFPSLLAAHLRIHLSLRNARHSGCGGSSPSRNARIIWCPCWLVALPAPRGPAR